ncbi:MAG: hypothetical protein ACLSEY_16995 [Enterocloster sp.]
MAGNKRRTGRPGGMTGTAPARVPARHNTAERRRTQSGKRQAVSGNEDRRETDRFQKARSRQHNGPDRPRPVRGRPRQTGGRI